MKRAWVIIGIAVCTLTSRIIAQYPDGPKTTHLTVKFAITGAESLPDREAIVAAAEKEVRQHYFSSNEIAERVRDQFQQHGYFKALVSQPEAVLTPPGPHQVMSIKVNVELGKQFRLDHIAFTGNTAFGSNELRRTIPIKDGDIFNVEPLRRGIKALRDLYGSRGYVNFTPVLDTRIDDERQLITIVFDLDEGSQFRVGNLIGLPDPKQ